MTLINVQDLKIHFFTFHGAAKAVDGVSFKIEKNRTLGLLRDGRAPASSDRHPATDNDPTHNPLKNLRLDKQSIAITTPCPTDDVNTSGYRLPKNTHILSRQASKPGYCP